MLADALARTLLDVLPILAVIAVFQALAFRRQPPQPLRIAVGAACIVAGIALFRTGLDLSLLPMAEGLATALAGRAAAPGPAGGAWLVLFAAALGLAATLIEPTVTAIAERVHDLSGGALRPFPFRLVVAAGMACGLALGTLRILLGFPLLWLLAPLLLLVIVLSVAAPRALVPLALDCGPMATSVVTVPVIAAFGASLARSLPGRDPLADGFGLVLLALLAPVGGLMLFACLKRAQARRSAGDGRWGSS